MLRYIIISIVLTIVISSAVCNEKRMKIAILDFSYNESKIDKGIANDIVELFISAFVNTGTFEVIERSRLHQFMKELSLQSSDDFDDAIRQKLGKLYGIETVIHGNVIKFWDSYTINIRGVGISSGFVLFADTLTVDSEEDIASKISMFVNELSIIKDKGRINPIHAIGGVFHLKSGIPFFYTFEVGLFGVSLTTGFVYDTKFVNNFSLQHEICIGVDIYPVCRPASFVIEYYFIPLFRFSKNKNAVFTLSAPGLYFGCKLQDNRYIYYRSNKSPYNYWMNVFEPVFRPGIIQRIGCEYYVGKRKKTIIGIFFSVNYSIEISDCIIKYTWTDPYFFDVYTLARTFVLNAFEFDSGFYIKTRLMKRKKI